MNPVGKYRPFQTIDLQDRKWPSQQILQAPIWGSVDLRDGNQSLPIPMKVWQKAEMFKVLVECGLKEIEVGFPAASLTEYKFIRSLIEEDSIPDDVTIQVLVQAREDLIRKTIQSLEGAKKVIIHLYNSTSPAQRRLVFGMEKQEIIALAVQGTEWVKKYSQKLNGTEVRFQYSPESFSGTEVEFSLEVCEAVMDVWQPTPAQKMIINLPNTVEVAMPNVYADQIEWFCRNMTRRDRAIISLHSHNDRGTGIAATELGLLAGADRVEGTLFGNGERTGNADLITLALNLFTQGIDPKLDFSNLRKLCEVYESCTGMEVSPRQPYSGELVFTAFSGSHQDAIRKGLRARDKKDPHSEKQLWEVPYLPIDPNDIGRKYHEVIRVNSQSGKGGIGYLLEKEYGMYLPKHLLQEFGILVKNKIDMRAQEVGARYLNDVLWKEYVNQKDPYFLESCSFSENVKRCDCIATIQFSNKISRIKTFKISGNGNGPIDAFVSALREDDVMRVRILNQSEHALGEGANASAISYIRLELPKGDIRWGIGVDTSVALASIRAVMSAINRESLLNRILA